MSVPQIDSTSHFAFFFFLNMLIISCTDIRIWVLYDVGCLISQDLKFISKDNLFISKLDKGDKVLEGGRILICFGSVRS